MSLSDKVYGAKELGSFTSEINDDLIDVVEVEDLKKSIQELQDRIKKDFKPVPRFGLYNIIEDVFGKKLSQICPKTKEGGK